MRTLDGRLGRRPGRVGRVEFWDRYGSVRDARCRADTLRDQSRTRALASGPRP